MSNQDRTTHSASTILHRLREHATRDPERIAFQEVDRNLAVVREYRYGELWRRTVAGAALLRAIARRGERILIFFEPGLEPVVVFFACLAAGMIAVPAALPASVSAAPRQRKPGAQRRLEAVTNLILDCDPSVAFAPESACAQVEAMLGDPASPPRVCSFAQFRAATDRADFADAPGKLPSPENIAFLQYTSGSTALPKGVVITHANLMHNQSGITPLVRTEPETVAVSWLPAFHDMGLVGDALNTVWTGCRCVKLRPADFLRRPNLWMEAVSKFRATVTGGPNFAFQLATQFSGSSAGGLDLSCLKVCYCGSEPIRAGTLEAFAAAYSPHGLRMAAIRPCYGLAEGTLVVSGLKGEEQFQTAPPPAEGAGAVVAGGRRRVVSCGRVACPDAIITITDPDTGENVPCGEPGEIRVRSKSVSPGYWCHLKAVNSPAIPDVPRELRTGDIGFLRGEELYVCGRLKHTLIVRGRKFIAEDVEIMLEHELTGLSRVRAVVFAVPAAERENIVVVLEGQPESTAITLESVRDAVTRILFQACNLVPDEVALVRPSSLPRTTSGKLQRQYCAELWAAGFVAARPCTEMASMAMSAAAAI